MKHLILAFAAVFAVSFLPCRQSFAADDDSFAGTKIGRWREHRPDLTLALRTSSYVAADGAKGYDDIAASAVAVERLANDNFTHYSATPLSAFFNSSVPDSAAYRVNTELTSSFSYVRNNRTQKIVASAGDDAAFAIVNEYVDSLPLVDNPARGEWRDSVVPVAAASRYFTDPFMVDFHCQERSIGGVRYLLSSYATDVFEQKLPGGYLFSGSVTGVGLERGDKDKAPMVAVRAMGTILDAAGNKAGVVNFQSYSIRQGEDLATIQTLVQDGEFAKSLAENLLVPKPEYLSSAAFLASRPAMEALPAAPEWIDALWDAVEVRSSCVLVQLEMRTNALWGDRLVAAGKYVKKATQGICAAVDKLPVSEKLKLPLKVVSLTVDTLLGPCIEATGHVLNGDWDAADATMNHAYFGDKDDPGFFPELLGAYAEEVGSIVTGLGAADPSTPGWFSPVTDVAGSVWDRWYDRFTDQLPSTASQAPTPPATSPYNATSGQLEDPVVWEDDPDAPAQPESPAAPSEPEAPPIEPPAPATRPAAPPAPEPASQPGQPIDAPLRQEVEWLWQRTGAGGEGMYIVAFDKYVDELFIVKSEPDYLIGSYPGPTKGAARMTRAGDAWVFTAVWGGDRARYELRRVSAYELVGQSDGGTSKWVRVTRTPDGEIVPVLGYKLLASEIIRHRAIHREEYARKHGTEAEKKKRAREYAEASAIMQRYLQEANNF